MPRPYRLSPEGKAVLTANAAKARAERDSTDAMIKRLVEKAPPPTAEQADRLRGWLANAPVSEADSR